MTKYAQQTVDVDELVRSGLLGLDELFDMASWRVVDENIASYTAYLENETGNKPGRIRIVLEQATKYGITAYRWATEEASGEDYQGPITIDRDRAESQAQEYAIDHEG